MNQQWMKPFYMLAALYDGALGIAFLFAAGSIFAKFGVEPPNHMAYVQFPAMLLILFAIMFYQIAMDPVKNRELILYGCGLKVAYTSLAFFYMFTTGIPAMWVPWAYADLVWLALFIWSWTSLGSRPQAV